MTVRICKTDIGKCVELSDGSVEVLLGLYPHLTEDPEKAEISTRRCMYSTDGKYMRGPYSCRNVHITWVDREDSERDN